MIFRILFFEIYVILKRLAKTVFANLFKIIKGKKS